MTEIEAGIAEYFSKEEHLHELRQKLLNLDGYQLRSEMAAERAALRAEEEQVAEELKKKHKKAMRELEERCQQEIQRLKETHEQELQRLSDVCGRELAAKQGELATREQELAAYQKSVADRLRRAEQEAKELARWQAGYGDLAAAYEEFLALSEKHRAAIAGIFGGCETPLAYLCGGVQQGHLDQLWDYVSGELAEAGQDAREAARIAALFDFSFAAVNASQREPLFRRLAAPVGAAFDGDTMGRAAGSPQLGRVARLVFAGYAHAVTGRVVRRSLVRLE